LTEIISAQPFVADEVLRLSVGLEEYSKHPLAQAILKAAESKKLHLPSVSKISEQPGEGMRGLVDRRYAVPHSHDR
jgi:cation transport ATPase